MAGFLHFETGVYGAAMTRFTDFETLKRPRSPNTFLVAPDGLCKNAAPDQAAPVFPMQASDLSRKLRGVVNSEGSWKDISVSEDGLKMHFIAVSSLLRFKDDVSVEILPDAGDPGQSTVAIYSASRVGHSDLGANGKRVRGLLGMLG